MDMLCNIKNVHLPPLLFVFWAKVRVPSSTAVEHVAKAPQQQQETASPLSDGAGLLHHDTSLGGVVVVVVVVLC